MKTVIINVLIHGLLLTGLHGQALSPKQKAQAKALINKNPKIVQQVQGGASQAGSMTPQQTEKARQILRDNPDLLQQKDKAPNKNKVESNDLPTMTDQVSSSTPPSESTIDTKSSMRTKKSIDTSKPIYGRALFTHDYQSVSSPDVSENYVIVPGDQILLRLWGRYNLEKIYTIGDDGYVFIDPLNKQIYLKGTTNKRLKRMIRNTVKDMAGVEGEVRVIATHPVQINISGQAIRPGTILIPPYYTFWQALMTSRGPSKTGSIRDIRLIRGNRTLFELDIYKYLKTGKLKELALKDNDLILFGDIGNVVKLEGIAKRSGLYELKSNETLKDLISHAGNFKANDISPVIQVERIIPIHQRKESDPSRKIIDIRIKRKNWQTFQLKDGDIVSEKSVPSSFENQVTINGNGIEIPGRYSIAKSPFTLWDLVQKAGGLTEGYSPSMEVVRMTDLGYQSIPIIADTDETLKSFQLTPYDSVLTYHQMDFQDNTSITVRGFVRESISFPYTENLTLDYVIHRAGGIKDGGLPYVYVKRKDARNIIQYDKVLLSDASSYKLNKRDGILAFNYQNFNLKFPVTVLVNNREPLKTEYSDDLTLEILFHRIGGLPINADSTQVEINTPDFTQPESFINTEYISLSEKTLKSPSLITPGVLIIVRNDPKKDPAHFVYLIGEFLNPGSYALVSNHETLMSVIKRANGLSQRGNPYSLRIHRRGKLGAIPISVKEIKPLAFDSKWLLADGDSVFAERNDNIVEVTGAVFSPSIVPYNEKYSWKDYVNFGGGGTLDTANIKRTYIEYPNLFSQKARSGWFRRSTVVPGSRIVVPIKPYKPPKQESEFKYSEFIGNLMSTVTVFATVITTYVLIKTTQNNSN